MNAHDAMLTKLTTAQSGSMVQDNAPGALARRWIITVPAVPTVEAVVGVAAAWCRYSRGREPGAR